MRQGEPEHPVKGEGAIEFTHADADMIDLGLRRRFVDDNSSVSTTHGALRAWHRRTGHPDFFLYKMYGDEITLDEVERITI